MSKTVWRWKSTSCSVAVIQERVNSTQAFEPFVLSPVCCESRGDLQCKCWKLALVLLHFIMEIGKGLSNTAVDKQGCALMLRHSRKSLHRKKRDRRTPILKLPKTKLETITWEERAVTINSQVTHRLTASQLAWNYSDSEAISQRSSCSKTQQTDIKSFPSACSLCISVLQYRFNLSIRLISKQACSCFLKSNWHFAVKCQLWNFIFNLLKS